MRSITLKILVTIVLPALTLGCGRGMARENLQNHAVSSLWEQFETVLYSKPEFVSSWDTNNPLPKDRASELRYPFADLWLALDSLPTKAASELLANSDAVLMGAKEFRAPNGPFGLGGVRSQRCYVVLLKSGSLFDFHKYIQNPSTTSAAGVQIWNWSWLDEFRDPDRQSSTFYAVKIEQSYFLVSNDLREIETLAKRLTSSSQDSQDTVGFHDWGGLLQHEMWGYRRYRLNDTDNKMAAGIEHVPPSAEALLFFLDANKKTVVLRLVLKDSTAESGVANLYSRHRLPPPMRSGGNAWEAAVPISSDQESFERLFSINVLFGFGVYT